MNYALNAFFHLLHITVILSSLFMCFFEDLLVIHLWLQASILSSWLILGPIMNKPGMCLLTEIQKKINKESHIEFPDSYMIYLYNKLGFSTTDTKKIDTVTFSVFAVCTLISIARIYT